ncbi:uncharacterized protein LOC113776538 isoform X4 [Coffea eugenioides]|uniref:uncharacterized protein LOC113776538 isoform X4 n=1 Tax=Coffea eugenioides TaxID=49369 RepID=UPI000F613DD7|nr:uncharacterized protein LOC113776538 isoform X4 [Coffea eugenioides]
MDIVTARETKEVAMGRKSSRILIAFVVIMLMAIAAYIKIWTIDYRISSQESLLLRSLYCNSLILPTEKPWMNLQSGGRGLIWRSRRVKCASRNSIKYALFVEFFAIMSYLCLHLRNMIHDK